ncbi:TonB-dependent receptor [Adhaeribacter aquaticus]|uniref:TonB-dependent receptor n=1 Tax=Adhaeribacter aquaticus TaxID=299567 RepID=UPI000423C83B|nr:TonB-dependent receptor [Adhaeribacter aquaticus]
MKKLLFILISFFTYSGVLGQNSLNVYVKDTETKAPLAGATVMLAGTTNGATADSKGFVSLSDLPIGRHTFRVSFLGYQEKNLVISFPRTAMDTLLILLEPSGEELDEVVISSTRSSRTIRDIPTRVEFIAGEELEEKANMKPGDIRMILNESTGIQTQQTSATSANASIRIQGLDGRYTQILKDGFPLYAGYAGGLGLLQTPPLDLKQVEVIKGSTSTLYGGGAIAGLVNLISKTPGPEQELQFLINGTSAGGLDLNSFYAKRFGKLGLTLYAARNSNAPYDPANIGFSAIPQFTRYTFNPKFFVYLSEKTKINVGLNSVIENRLGGDIQYIRGTRDNTHSYFEQNKTGRFSTQFTLDHAFSESHRFTLKNSINNFNRDLSLPNYKFSGKQISSFTEANYSNSSAENLEWIAGVNVWTDAFKEKEIALASARDYTQTTLGAFAQNTWKTTSKLNIETGFRTDYVVNYGFAFLPRISALYKIRPNITSRLGGGFGYKAPTIFTEESERLQFRNILPINEQANTLERSYGANWDISYRTSLFQESISLSINHLFFYTFLNNPLLLKPRANSLYQFQNITGHIASRGTETNIKIGYQDFNLFLGYTFTNTKIREDDIDRLNPLTPRHRINAVLMYEVEDKWKLGAESYYYGKQVLSDGGTGTNYLLAGFMAEKLFPKFSLFINFENFLDVRQTRFDSIYTGPISNPVFRDIYAPLDGFVINGGLKIKL